MTTSEPESEKDVGAESQKVLLAGLPFTHPRISTFLSRAKAEMPLRPVRFPFLGEYQDCFTGEDFVAWLLENVPDFQKDLDIVLVAARELTEREDLLRRLGEFGNKFDHADDAFYQFRPKVFYVLSQTVEYILTLDRSGFRARPTTIEPDCKQVPCRCITLGAHCPRNREDLWHTRRYRKQGVGFKRRAPFHPTKEGSNQC